MYPYGLIGNCQISALISDKGSLDWLCLPRPDGEPIFGQLLDPDGGCFSVTLQDADELSAKQFYIENTNILVTELSNKAGQGIRITDFCPRFEQFGRMFRPLMVIRMVEPITSGPFIKVECKPVNGWKKAPVAGARGNSHLRFDFADDNLRLTTDMPMTYLQEASPFQIQNKIYLALTWSSTIDEDLASVCERFLIQTRDYWRTWVKHCSVPTLFQAEVIRSALTLKLHCYEDTGAILAATTTSLPEERGGMRNWDYRFCWLRDAHFTLSAFHRLGHFEEMEGFLKFLLDIISQSEASQDQLAPVYTLSRGLPLPELSHDNWSGYANSKPVRSCNQAAEHIQNDVYGEMILTLAPIYFDKRFHHLRNPGYQRLLERLATLASRSIGKADAGLWEFRNGWQEHSFTNLMLWAGLERVQRIHELGFLPQLQIDPAAECKRAELAVLRAVNRNIVMSAPNDGTPDSSLALLGLLRFPDRTIVESTLENLMSELATDKTSNTFFYRYLRKDDFGTPQSAFVICSFWFAEALARLGQVERARKITADAILGANSLGLFSEHFDQAQKRQLGNFPQAYSHVGLINAAFAVSPPWSEVL